MNTPLIARLATALVLVTGLAAGPLTPAPAQTPPAAVVAKPKLPDRCWPSYKHDLQRLQRRMDVQAPHYESHYQSVAAQLDSMVDVVSSGATEVLPQMEAGVAQYRDILSPIIADDRDSAMRLVKSVEKANKNCFRGARQSTFLSGIQSVRAANRDLFRAYEKVQLAALHLTTAQTAKAQEALNDAQLEAVTVEDQFDRGMKRLRSLR